MITQYLPSRVILKIDKISCVFIYYGRKRLLDILFEIPSSTGKFKEEFTKFRFGFWPNVFLDENTEEVISCSLPENEFNYYVYAKQHKKKLEICMEPIKNLEEHGKDMVILGYVSGFLGLPQTGVYKYKFKF